ncbi:MAG: hypothetical protein AAF732_09580 [Pseudomonadota bacterium]
MNASQHTRDAIILAAAIIVTGSVIIMRLWVPEDVASYVRHGLLLPVLKYSLLLPLIACGCILSSERPAVLFPSLVVLAATLWLGLRWAEPTVLSDQQLAVLLVRYPVLATTTGVAAGCALLLPPRARRWLVPLVCAICGFGLSLSIALESPGDDYSGWFSSAGGLGGIIVVIASIALAGTVQQFGSSAWLSVGGRILGSWLIAASLMLAGSAVVPQRPLGSLTIPATLFNGADLPREP